MKVARSTVRIILLTAILIFLRAAHAQGTFRFVCNIEGFELYNGGRIPVKGSGSLTLNRTTVNFDLFIPVSHFLPREAHFHGPAVAGETPQYSLPAYTVLDGAGIRYVGSRDLPGQFVTDLKDGKWYINLHSADYENAVLTGYIVPVPESAPICLFLLGSVMLAASTRRNTDGIMGCGNWSRAVVAGN
jgi:hypothetical protein